jgi:hypothetical protein
MKSNKQHPLFGEVRTATDEEINEINRLVADYPVEVFSALNRRFNKVGICLSIASLLEDEEEGHSHAIWAYNQIALGLKHQKKIDDDET